MSLFRPNMKKLKARKDIEGLIEVLKDSNASVRWGAAIALGGQEMKVFNEAMVAEGIKITLSEIADELRKLK